LSSWESGGPFLGLKRCTEAGPERGGRLREKLPIGFSLVGWKANIPGHCLIVERSPPVFLAGEDEKGRKKMPGKSTW